MMSISPLVGQPPYSKYLGMSQMAGHSQSPLGNLARTQTLPYVKVKDSTVVNLPLKTGLIQLTPSDWRLQPLLKGAVQKSPGEPPHISQQELFLTAAAPIFSSVGTGWMQRMELLVQVVVLLLSQIWNQLLPPPAMVRSCRHFLKSSLSNQSQKMSLVDAATTKSTSNNVLGIDMCLKYGKDSDNEDIQSGSKLVQLSHQGRTVSDLQAGKGKDGADQSPSLPLAILLLSQHRRQHLQHTLIPPLHPKRLESVFNNSINSILDPPPIYLRVYDSLLLQQLFLGINIAGGSTVALRSNNYLFGQLGGDEEGSAAQQLKVRGRFWGVLEVLIEDEHCVEEGCPVELEGSHGQFLQPAKQFASHLESYSSPGCKFEVRLTSHPPTSLKTDGCLDL